MYYAYALKSEFDNRLYVGFTDNLQKRVAQHNKGIVEATKDRRPLKLVYYEACLTKKNAVQREKYFKTGYG